MRGLLFDLDETLMVEEPSAVAAFEATARHAACIHDLDAGRLAVAARRRARELWRAAPTHDYCRRVGISSWEGLWCRYEGDAPETRRLREWSSTYRRQAWTLALSEQAIEDDELGETLGDRFVAERRARHVVFADAPATLRELRSSYVLGLVTNGASCLQREKLRASGLSDQFEVVVVSAEVGVAKPDSSVFKAAAAELGVGEDAVMIGDSIEKDVNGALAAGLQAVWVNRSGRARPDDLPDVPAVTTLEELPLALADLR
jgi:putative hydrolase of the HAD superfamily